MYSCVSECVPTQLNTNVLRQSLTTGCLVTVVDMHAALSLQSHSRPSLQHKKQRMCQIPYTIYVQYVPMNYVVILYCMRPRELYSVVQAVLVVMSSSDGPAHVLC